MGSKCKHYSYLIYLLALSWLTMLTNIYIVFAVLLTIFVHFWSKQKSILGFFKFHWNKYRLESIVFFFVALFCLMLSFHFKSIGALWFGGREGFFQSTLFSLGKALTQNANWFIPQEYFNLIFSVLFLSVAVGLILVYLKGRDFFSQLVALMCIAPPTLSLAQYYLSGTPLLYKRTAYFLYPPCFYLQFSISTGL